MPGSWAFDAVEATGFPIQWKDSHDRFGSGVPGQGRIGTGALAADAEPDRNTYQFIQE